MILATIPLFPLGGFVVLALLGKQLGNKLSAFLGCMSIACAGVVTFALLPQASIGIHYELAPWLVATGIATARFSFLMDPLSGTMAAVVCLVGLLIHIYSIEYMKGDPGFSRYFAYLNLFVSAMLTLLLAGDLLLLFLGWEGVGLCSYLLIGFWYQETANGHAAEKAFIVTRIGDVAFLLAMFLVLGFMGTWDLTQLPQQIFLANMTPSPTWLFPLLAFLILLAACGKSAQLPLHVWLPDAMAGPTPVSALIHAATMVTAGVYLIARLNLLFLAAPTILFVVAVVGAITALYAALTALGQNDIKRVLAYSTISQIGYMFMGLGLGAFSAALFHFMTHAFFKALLFLGAGAVIHALHGEQDMRQMGGLRHKLPLIFWTFLAGSAALAALPFISAGFYSKDAILWAAYAEGSYLIWGIGVVTALITAAYTTRMVWKTFMGAPYSKAVHAPGVAIKIPLSILALLSLSAGFVWLPHSLGGFEPWQTWLQPVFHHMRPWHGSLNQEITSQLIASLAGLTGIGLMIALLTRSKIVVRPWLKQLSVTGFFVDHSYQIVFVGGVKQLARLLSPEWFDRALGRLLSLVRQAALIAASTQNGRLRWYLALLVAGVILLGIGGLWR